MPKKRSNGEGSIFREASGRYRIAVTKTENGKKVRRTKTAWKMSDAVALLSELRGSTVTPRKQTVAGFLKEWLTTVVEKECEATTADSYRRSVNKHISPHIGAKLISDLSPLDVQSWISRLDDLDVGGRTRQNAFTVLSAALEKAVDFRIVPTNPCERIKRPRHEAEEMKPFTLEESRKILSSTEGTRIHALLHTAITCGIRQGELFGLPWSSILWDAEKIRIDQQACYLNGVRTIKKPKTKKSIRTIDAPPSTMAALREHKRILEREGNGENLFVFPAREGGLVDRASFRSRVWKPLLKKLGIAYRGFHNTRHTYATIAIAAGADIAVVSKQLGHSRISITWDVYHHVLELQQQRSTEIIGNLFR